MRSWKGFVLAPLLLVGCGGDDTPDALTSVVQGKLELSTFTAGPTGVDAINDAGVRSHIGIAPDGAFRLELLKDHTYRLVVLTGQGEMPVAFPRSAQQLDRRFHLDDGNVVLDLGVIRLFPKAPDTGVVVPAPAPIVCAPGVAADPEDDFDDLEGPEENADPAQPYAAPDLAPPRVVAGCKD